MKLLLKNWQWFLNGAVLLALVLAGTKYLSGEHFWRALRDFNWLYAPLILGLSALYLALKGWRLSVPLGRLKNVKAGVVMRCYAAGQAVSLLPGGAAAYAAMLKRAGVPVANTGAALILTSLLDQLLFLVTALTAAFFVPKAHEIAEDILPLIGLWIALLAIPFTRLWMRVLLEAVLKQFGWLAGWRDLLKRLKFSFEPAILLPTLGATVGALVLMTAALNLAVSGVGADISFLTSLLAYSLSSLAGRFSPTPGGVGVTEAVMIGLLTQASEIGLNEAAAAVALFRVGTTLFGALLGTLVYFFLWKGESETVFQSSN